MRPLILSAGKGGQAKRQHRSQAVKSGGSKANKEGEAKATG